MFLITGIKAPPGFPNRTRTFTYKHNKTKQNHLKNPITTGIQKSWAYICHDYLQTWGIAYCTPGSITMHLMMALLSWLKIASIYWAKVVKKQFVKSVVQNNGPLNFVRRFTTQFIDKKNMFSGSRVLKEETRHKNNPESSEMRKSFLF